MKRLSSGVNLLVLAVLAVMLASCPATAGLSDVLERKSLIVAMPAEDVYPYCYQGPDGTLMGNDVDMARDIARRLSADFEPDRSSPGFDGIIGKLARNEADLGISGLKVLLPHLLRTTMSRPYLELRYALIANRLNLSVVEVSGAPSAILSGVPCKRIGTLDKTGYEEHVLELFPGSKVIKYKKIEDMIRDTASGRIPASFCDELEARAAFQRLPDLGIALQLELLDKTRDEVALAVSWKDRSFKRWLDLYLDSRPSGLDAEGLLKFYPLP